MDGSSTSNNIVGITRAPSSVLQSANYSRGTASDSKGSCGQFGCVTSDERVRETLTSRSNRVLTDGANWLAADFAVYPARAPIRIVQTTQSHGGTEGQRHPADS